MFKRNVPEALFEAERLRVWSWRVWRGVGWGVRVGVEVSLKLPSPKEGRLDWVWD